MGESLSDTILQTAPFGYAYHQIMVDAEGKPLDYRFIEVNNSFEKLTGLKEKDILGKTVTQVMPDILKDPANWIQVYGKVALGGETLSFEQYSQPLGKWFQVQAHCPKPGFFTTIFTDVTSFKVATEELENFFQVNLDLLCIADLDGRFLKVNHAWQEILGFSKDYLESSKFLDFVHPEDIQGTLAAMADLGSNRDVLDFTNRYRCHDGTYRYIQWRSKPKGSLIYAAARDITQRVLNEQKLQERETRLISLFDSLDDLILVLNPQGEIIEFQPSHEQRLIIPPKAFVGKTFAEVPFPEPARTKILESLGKVKESKQPQRLTYSLTSPGQDHQQSQQVSQQSNQQTNPNQPPETQWFDALLSPMFLPGGEYIGITAVIRNITDMHRLTEELEQKRQQLEEIITGTNAGTWQWKVQTGEVSFNRQWAKMIGYTIEELEPISIETWETFTHPDDLARSGELLAKHFTGETEYYECEARMRHKDGHWVWVLDRGKVSHWSEDGKPLRMAGTHQNISARKEFEAQLIQAREEALQASKAKGSFLSVMSHEIRTPLNGVIGFSDLLLQTPLSAMQKEYAQNAKSSGVLLLEIINNILDFSKLEAGKLELDYQQLDLIDLLKEVFHIIQFGAREKHLELILWTDPGIPRVVFSDPLRLKQILVNLMSNGVKFTHSGEIELSVTLQARNKSSKSTDSKDSHDIGVPTASETITTETRATDTIVEFEIRDTGVGMNPDQLEKLFQPFSQVDSSVTRKFGGTGLGLSIAKILVEQMGGTIGVTSQEGIGTSFKFSLPFPSISYNASESSFPPISLLDSLLQQHTDNLVPWNSPPLILIIEDNLRQQQVVSEYLEILGVRVQLASLSQIDRDSHFPTPDGIILGMNDEYSHKIQGCLDSLGAYDLTQIPTLVLSPAGQRESFDSMLQNCPHLTWVNKPIGMNDLFPWLISIGKSDCLNPVSESFTLWNPLPQSLGTSQESLVTPENQLVVLIADDVPMNLILFEAYFRKLLPKALIITAVNGLQVLEKLTTFIEDDPNSLPQLIFMDVQMPDMDGITTTKEIRNSKDPRVKHIPIIALTAAATQSDEQSCLLAGMNGFLTKPLTLPTLETFLKTYHPKFLLDNT